VRRGGHAVAENLQPGREATQPGHRGGQLGGGELERAR
jgi:hypothetical protein